MLLSIFPLYLRSQDSISDQLSETFKVFLALDTSWKRWNYLKSSSTRKLDRVAVATFHWMKIRRPITFQKEMSLDGSSMSI